jgi:hypothetical protein
MSRRRFERRMVAVAATGFTGASGVGSMVIVDVSYS